MKKFKYIGQVDIYYKGDYYKADKYMHCDHYRPHPNEITSANYYRLPDKSWITPYDVEHNGLSEYYMWTPSGYILPGGYKISGLDDLYKELYVSERPSLGKRIVAWFKKLFK